MSALTHCSVFILAAAVCCAASTANAQTTSAKTTIPSKTKAEVSAAAPSPAPVPAYDVYLADLLEGKIANVKKVNASAGYHNQPAFSVNGTHLYFTSQQGSGEKSQMDIASYDIKTGKLDLFQSTVLSEYSPTVLPADQALSAVVVEADGKQRLWRLPVTGEPAVMLPEVVGVGYHAWGPADDVLLFLLGKDEADHQIAYRNSTGELTTLARNIGRGLAWRPGTNEGYYSERSGERLALRMYETQNMQQSAQLILLPETAQDFRWWNRDLLITSAGQKLHSWQPGDKRWQRWLDLSDHCDGSVSRFSFSIDQKQLAFVCQPAGAKP
jgi:hypothetical protein